MVAHTRERLKHLLKIDFVRFCIVGGIGFTINLIILSILHATYNTPIFLAQLIGSEIALFCNFLLHNHWTYKSHNVQKSFTKLIIQFHATTWPAILGSTFMVTLFEKILHFNNLSALAVASAIALFWNFGWSKYVVWRNITPAEIERIAG